MSSKKLNYLSIGESIDGTTFCSGVEAFAENIVESNEGDAVIAFPSRNGWCKPRSSNYRLTDQNAEIILPLPIYKVKSVKLNLSTVQASFDGTRNLSSFKDDAGNTVPNELDITGFVFQSIEWQALKNAERTGEGEFQGMVESFYKDNTLHWEEGDDKIPVLGTVYKYGSLFADKSPTYNRLLRCALWRIGEPYKYLGNTLRETAEYISDLETADVRDWQFRVEYIPVSTKTKIRARKSEKQNAEYLQPFNQRAEVNAASAFGKNMWLTAQKTGTREIAIVKNYTKLTDIPPVGALVKHNGKRYKIVANSYNQTNTVYLQVTHTLSENWTSKSKHVSVNQKYRNYNIPQDILWRNMYWEDYVTVTAKDDYVSPNDAGIQLADVMRIFMYDSSNDNTIDTFAWGFNLNEIPWSTIGVTVPCSTYGMANSMVFFASFKDNMSAGLRINSNDNTLCEEVLYCKDDGTLQTAYAVFSDGIINCDNDLVEDLTEGTAEQGRKVYPAIVSENGRVYNAPKAQIFNKKFYVDKDPGEAIKFTYQVHFVTEGDCVVGNKLAEHNPLVKRYEDSDNARPLRVWLLKNYIREGEDKLLPTDSDKCYERIGATTFFTIDIREQDGRRCISLGAAPKALLSQYKAWAITDINNNLYVGRNENQEGVVYFYISHNRL